MYGGVPPSTTTVASPFSQFPEDKAGSLDILEDRGSGSVIIISWFVMATQPKSSVTVTLYVPAGMLAKSSVVSPLLHK